MQKQNSQFSEICPKKAAIRAEPTHLAELPGSTRLGETVPKPINTHGKTAPEHPLEGFRRGLKWLPFDPIRNPHGLRSTRPGSDLMGAPLKFGEPDRKWVKETFLPKLSKSNVRDQTTPRTKFDGVTTLLGQDLGRRKYDFSGRHQV